MYLLESNVTICVHFFEPIEFWIVNYDHKVKIALVANLNTFLHQVLRSTVLGITKVI